MKFLPTDVIFISGPITGISDAFKRFEDTANHIHQITGAYVINPTGLPRIFIGRNQDDRNFWLRKGDELLIRECNYIFMMDGWEKSAGCWHEYNIANDLGIKVINGLKALTHSYTT